MHLRLLAVDLWRLLLVRRHLSIAVAILFDRLGSLMFVSVLGQHRIDGDESLIEGLVALHLRSQSLCAA